MPNTTPADFEPASETETALVSTDRYSLSTKSNSPDRSIAPPPSIPGAIPNSSLLEHIATSRFFHHYVSPTRTLFRLDLDFTQALIQKATKRGILAEAIIAMGILTLPKKDGSVHTAARIRHNRALRLTNVALRDSAYAESDEMLMAVILLGLYEVRRLSYYHNGVAYALYMLTIIFRPRLMRVTQLLAGNLISMVPASYCGCVDLHRSKLAYHIGYSMFCVYKLYVESSPLPSTLSDGCW